MAHQQHSTQAPLLGEFRFPKESSLVFGEVWQMVQQPHFQELSAWAQWEKFHETLFQTIQKVQTPAFLLPELLDLYYRIQQKRCFHRAPAFVHFEFWLNHFSGLSWEEERQLRGKIVGKYLPREAFQVFFPLGMQRIYPGSHFVVAHLSPDVDTMTASFWGWMDAFGAKIGLAQHLWILPGGPPDSAFTQCFSEIVGRGVWDGLATTQPRLTLKAMDLLTRKGLIQKSGSCLTVEIDHAAEKQAVILVDSEGYYLGDWRSSDIEPVGQVTLLFKSVIRWFGSHYLGEVISFMAAPKVSKEDFLARGQLLLQLSVQDSAPFLDFEDKQKTQLHLLLQVGLKIPEGAHASFEKLFTSLVELGAEGIAPFLDVGQKELADLFTEKGDLKEERGFIFRCLETMRQKLDRAVLSARNFMERLDLAILIQRHVLLQPPSYIRLTSDVEEMREKMGHHPSLTVVHAETEEKLFPMGVVWADVLSQRSLGTVSFRDFSNPDEAKMAPYLDVISVVDHHKSALKTSSIPTVLVGDAQSCNVLLAEESFHLNDRYGVGGLSREGVKKQLQERFNPNFSSLSLRLMQRLLQRQMVYEEGSPYYVHREREFAEYLTFLYAILDDTDLLSKVSDRDVWAVAHLLNRLKSLSLEQETEVVQLQDLPKDSQFAKAAAERLLKDPDLYSLYRSVYAMREKEVAESLQACVDRGDNRLFADTKELNGCARVGQIKLFSCHFPEFLSHVTALQKAWLQASQEAALLNPELVLHIQMISTIPSAEDVYSGGKKPYPHRDEMWIYLSQTRGALDVLQHFLSSFRRALKSRKEVVVQLLGEKAMHWEPVFREYFDVEIAGGPDSFPQGMALARLRFAAGRFNSRKSAVSVHLPSTIPA